MSFKYHTFHYKRVLPPVLIMAVLVGALFLYGKNQELVTNYKPYYYKSYLAVINYHLAQIGDLFNSKPVRADTEQTAESIPVLLYHGVITDRPDGANVTIDNFINQMVSLKRAGYQTISIDDYQDFISHGKKVPKKSFLLTFDDGRKDSFYPAEPLMEALNYRATMFVITGQSFNKDSKFYLSQDELLKMKGTGHWDLQAHTRNGHSLYPVDEYTKGHFYSNKLWLADQKRYESDGEFEARIRDDLKGAKEDMQKYLGINSKTFAVPFGDIGETESNYRDAGSVLVANLQKYYQTAFIQFWSGRGFSQNYSGTNQTLNKRIEVDHTWTGQNLLDELERGSAKSLPFNHKPSAADGWMTTWGSSFFTTDGAVLNASVKSTGAAVDLDGSYSWLNYRVKAVFKLVRGSNFKLLLRAQETNSYLACSYTSNTVQLQQIIDGASKILGETHMANIDLTNDTKITGTVNANIASCSVPGGDDLSVKLGQSRFTKSGGIGLVIYDKAANNAEGIIKNIEVSKIK